ncbi:4220_t:CDS:1 [Paraglomus occultum]|uniref:4220_t:CDS:1 n=1 Tax=Paraglomus occultum TaxID=144539 RepID=A0A9N9G4M9_9GLOM|nr:4220_t:CDS:1 [Paraglomus occultum]
MDTACIRSPTELSSALLTNDAHADTSILLHSISLATLVFTIIASGIITIWNRYVIHQTPFTWQKSFSHILGIAQGRQLETNQRSIVRSLHSSPTPLRSIITTSPRSSLASRVHDQHKIEQQEFTKTPSPGIKNSKFKMTREHMANASFEEKFGLLLLGIDDDDWRESLGSYYYGDRD